MSRPAVRVLLEPGEEEARTRRFSPSAVQDSKWKNVNREALLSQKKRIPQKNFLHGIVGVGTTHWCQKQNYNLSTARLRKKKLVFLSQINVNLLIFTNF